MEILHISDLSFSYPETDTPALQDISFSVSAGEFVVICGESGCGKTTLLKLLKPALAPAGAYSNTAAATYTAWMSAAPPPRSAMCFRIRIIR